jgi:hypothetical protein
VPGGDFEQGAGLWSLNGGATVVPGPEPWKVTNKSEKRSLALPAGSSAIAPAFCVDVNDPTIRFFAVNRGDPTSTLLVAASFTTALGISVTLPIGAITSQGRWAPVPPGLTLVNAIGLVAGTPVRFSFAPVGAGNWRIDDVYVDPWGRS